MDTQIKITGTGEVKDLASALHSLTVALLAGDDPKYIAERKFHDILTVEFPAPSLPAIDWTRINNDTNGNPRYVCHFLTFISDKDREDEKVSGSTDTKYSIALARAKKLGGRKFHNKQYGGGIVFQSYNINALTKEIFTLMQQYE